MISTTDLRTIADERLLDADAMLQTQRYDGGIYLCGYAVEMALKARICDTLDWAGFPSSGKEFEAYKSFKTHDLETLLSLSGRQNHIKSNLFAAWSVVSKWDPESRYSAVGVGTAADLQQMIAASRAVIAGL